MAFPVLGQRIMTVPIQFFLTVSGEAYRVQDARDPECKAAMLISRHCPAGAAHVVVNCLRGLFPKSANQHIITR